MTSIDFLNKVHKSLDSQEYSLSYSPAKSKNYMLYCNGNFIGGLFDEELCFVYADSVSELLGQPEPVYRGYSNTAQHRMLVIPEEHWVKALKLLYAEKFDWSRLVYDITYTSIGAAVVEDFYDENVVFLRFCFEKELLKKNPLDRQGRILRMVYLNQDLTNIGKNLFPELLDKFLAFFDRKGKTSLETMLQRWYTALEKEYCSQTAGQGGGNMTEENRTYITHLKVTDVPWHRLTTAYGRGTEFPAHLAVLEQMRDLASVKESLYELTTNMEHQSTLWHATPFGMVFMCRILEKALADSGQNPVAHFLAGELLDFFSCILQCFHDGDEMEHAEPLPLFSDLLKEEYLWSEEYDEEEDEMRYEEDEVFPDDLFYSFYYYSWQAVKAYQDVLEQVPAEFAQPAAAVLELL